MSIVTPKAIRMPALLLLAVAAWVVIAGAQAPAATTFAALVERLSEPGGDFGGDNLISNEQSYLHVMTALEAAKVTGGAYVGVGPDQNFSYIAQIRPHIAYIVDIRRDNLLLHLLFKAIFNRAPTPVEYVSLLTGRAPPAAPAGVIGIEKVVAYIDATPALPAPRQATLENELDLAMKSLGVPLSTADFSTIHSFRRQFVSDGLSLTFQVRGQGPRSYYPSLRTLLLETDRNGKHRSFLADDSSYQVVRSLEERDLIVPVVGDVSGAKAMPAIAADMRARGDALSAFYISNVEQYLFQDGRFPAWVENLKRMPHDERSMIIRSVFPSGYRGSLPQSVPGYYSTSLTQPLGRMLSDIAGGKYSGYADLVLASVR
jgi:hypothetical protein